MQNNELETRMEHHTLMFAKRVQTASTMKQHRSHSLLVGSLWLMYANTI